MGLHPCNWREDLDRNCRLGYLVVGWAVGPCDRRENLDRNCRVGYLVVGWALCPLMGGRISIGNVGWDS